MKKTSTLIIGSLVTVFSIGAMTATAYAWHPQGAIIKEVQDQTTGSAMVDANDASSALNVNTGDTLVYTVTVSNNGAVASDGDDNMANTVVTDTLPTGVELISDPTQRTISEDLGTLIPGQNVTRTYSVKVTDTTNGDIITNTACFTGNSIVNDSPQSGCDTAVVKASVPMPAPAPTPTSAPTLPDTGNTALSAGLLVGIVAIASYVLNVLRLMRNTDLK
jgi:uncharacterized repeat protein (TIGR01451 family)